MAISCVHGRISAPARPEVSLYLRPDAFAQAHQDANELLVRSALEALAPGPVDRVLELYAGNGNFTFAVAARAKEVTAVESSSISVELGRRSTTEAGIANVRWVLGEQRARMLRGAKMEEVIFQGSSARRPVNVAEVALTFENDEGQLPIAFREVVIARRLSRSGESEYLLNGTVCRLRDIHDLLRGTGLGAAPDAEAVSIFSRRGSEPSFSAGSRR